MVNKQVWLDEGLAVLSEQGATGLRIDRLAERLSLSKGSFYHHFPGISAYRFDLLSHYESQYTTRYIDVVEQQKDLGPRERLALLQELVMADETGPPDVGAAVRIWAAQDDDARVVQERIDTRRLDYLTGLWQLILGDRRPAVDVSRLFYLLLIGAHHVVPPLPISDLGRLYDLLATMADEAVKP